ncbi:MAG: Uma2 family endonuclease [Verrucomicrobiales bacterium]|nr:Uma2 family endonuclease [Verrucomicrobiales bacterium]
MKSASSSCLVSVTDYLRTEELSRVKREYVEGGVYPRDDTNTNHNTAAGNALVGLHAALKGKKCRPFNSDMKVRIATPFATRFYYPDVSVVCDSNPPDSSYQDRPVVIIEVISESTRRLDEGEKRDGYFQIPTLRVYLLVETNIRRVRVFRRGDHGFEPEVYTDLDEVIPLPEIDASLSLADLYENVVIGGDAPDSEDD